jgi:hypothetical protein
MELLDTNDLTSPHPPPFCRVAFHGEQAFCKRVADARGIRTED